MFFNYLQKLELQKQIAATVKENADCSLAARTEIEEHRRKLKIVEEVFIKVFGNLEPFRSLCLNS
jgi:hypothetical protein